MKYKIILDKNVTELLCSRSIPDKDKAKISKKIDGLAENPRPRGLEKLKEIDGIPVYRVRFGDYRVIYSVTDDKLLVLILKVRNRREVYR